MAHSVYKCALCRPAVTGAGLHTLYLHDNKDGTDVCMPAVAKLMPQLTSLDVRHTGTSEVGLAWLQQASRLQTVCFCGHHGKMWPWLCVAVLQAQTCSCRIPQPGSVSGLSVQGNMAW